MSGDFHARHLARWLAASSGCGFAARFAQGRDGRLYFTTVDAPPEEIDRETVEGVNDALDACGDAERAGVVVFPAVSSAEDLIAVLHRLGLDDRWTVTTRLDPERGLLVRVQWRTKHGPLSDGLGLAPLFTMPLPRRAPVAAIALWPGAAAARRAERAEDVGFIDMPSGLDRTKHRAMLRSTSEHVERMLGETPDRAPWREVAFCLDPALLKRFGT